MRAVVIDRPGSISVQTLPDPSPGPGEVLVAPDGCGICGTDLHILDGDLSFTSYPIVPGHEFSGRVVALGPEVTGHRIGDLVAVEPSIFCGRCHFCRHGRENLCENFNAIGVGNINGGMAELCAVPAHKAIEMPASLPRHWGGLIEPVACAVHGIDMAQIKLGDHVLIYGAGTMGLILCQLARRAGAGSVAVIDINAGRLDRAIDLGADVAATSADGLDRTGWDVVIDATGAVPAIEDGMERVRPGGTVLLFGVTSMHATARMNPYKIYSQEIRVIGSMAIAHSFERAVSLVASGAIDGERLITDRYKLDCIEQAIDHFKLGTGLKIVVEP